MTIRLKHLIPLPALLGFVLPAILYRRLPELVPMHWNWRGEIDAYAARPLGAFLMPALTLFVYLLLLLVPKTAPREFSIAAFRVIYEWISLGVVGFMFFVSALLTLVAAGLPATASRPLLALLGLSLIVVGVGLLRPRIALTRRTNHIPERTRRLASKLILTASVITFAAAVLGSSLLPAMIAVPTAILFPLAYSLVQYWQTGSAKGPTDFTA
jgi:uncharacterized membrane protein